MTFTIQMAGSLYNSDEPLIAETIPTLLTNTGKNIAACTAVALALGGPVTIAGAAIVGAAVHPTMLFVSWLGRKVVEITDFPEKISAFFDTNKLEENFKLLIQAAVAIAAIASALFMAIKYAPALGITEKTIVALSGSLTFPTALAFTAVALVGSYLLDNLYTFAKDSWNKKEDEGLRISNSSSNEININGRQKKKWFG